MQPQGFWYNARMRENRFIGQDRCYHLISRLAHRAFFLDDEEKDRAVALMRRVEEFSGVVVLAYAFMSNHFHIFVYVPKAEEIDKDFYNKLMEMDKDPAKKKEFLKSLKPRISADALKATENRLNEAIEHAKKLDKEGKVFGNDDWKDKERLSKMPMINRSVEIVNSDGQKIEVDRKMGEDKNKKKRNFVATYLTNSCQSYYNRDYLQYMFS